MEPLFIIGILLLSVIFILLFIFTKNNNKRILSSHSKEKTMGSFDTIREMPNHYQKEIDEDMLVELAKKLSKTDDGAFKYYNPFCCPHCLAPFNDYPKFREDRPNDIYVHFYLNKPTVRFQ